MLTWQTGRMPKSGSTILECEDFAAANPERGQFAVADGVTESIGADRWAELIANVFVKHPIPSPSEWPRYLDKVREAWWKDFRSLSLPWYAEHKLADGAAATFVAVQIATTGTWSAIAVGDSVLLHQSADGASRSFPISSASEFSSVPEVVRSRAPINEPELRCADGTWRPGDRFFLMTDALAKFCIDTGGPREDRQCRTELTDALISAVSWQERVSALRANRLIRDDDVCFVSIRV